MADRTETQNILRKAKTYLDKHPEDIPIRRLYQKLEISLHIWDHHFDEHAHQLAEKIWAELETYDTWYESDLKMLNAILFHFPVDSIHLITDKILNTLDRYKDYKNIQPAQFALLGNLSTVYLYNDYREDCERITTIILNLSKRLKRYDYLGFAYARLGICRNDFEQIRKGLDILDLTDETDGLVAMEDEVKRYVPNFLLINCSTQTVRKTKKVASTTFLSLWIMFSFTIVVIEVIRLVIDILRKNKPSITLAG